MLLEIDAGFVAFEVKMTGTVADTDARHLRNLSSLLDKPLIGAFVISDDLVVRTLTGGVRAVPAAWLLGAARTGS